MAKDFDTILDRVGSFGRYQLQMVCVVVIPASLIVALQINTRMFQAAVPNHWCSVPGVENTHYTEGQWKNITIPRSADGAAYSQCRAYSIDWQDGAPRASNDTHECSSWEYDRSLMQDTLATSFDWVCSKELYSSHILSICTVGNSIGTLILPVLADKYTGRRPMFLMSIVIDFVFNLLPLFITSFSGQMTVRFLAGLSFQSNYQMSYLIALEFLSPEYRALTAFLSFSAWTVGMCITSLLAWSLRSWRYLLWAVLLCDVYMFGLWFYLPESPRWLLSHHRVKDATKVMLKVAKVNNTSDQVEKDTLFAELSTIEDDDKEKVSVLSILHFPKFRLTAVLLLILSGVSFLGYGILTYDINVLPDHYYMNFFILSLVEIPGGAAGWISCQYFGRRFTGIVTYALTAVLCVGAILLADHKIALLVVVGAMKCMLTVAIYVLYLQVTELYPTTLRSTGMGGIVVFGNLTVTSAPYIINSGLGVTFSYIVILVGSIIGFLCMLPLPETLELPLPQTLPEAESVGSTRPLRKWVHRWNHHKYKPVPFSELKLQRVHEKENLSSGDL